MQLAGVVQFLLDEFASLETNGSGQGTQSRCVAPWVRITCTAVLDPRLRWHHDQGLASSLPEIRLAARSVGAFDDPQFRVCTTFPALLYYAVC